MADKTAISWTDATWNPTTGCTRVSSGCDHCYIDRTPPFRMQGRRFDGEGPGSATGVLLHPERLDQPLRWPRPRRVFVNSLSDLFHDDIPDEFIAQVFGVMAFASQHIFQVLTKRSARMRALLNSDDFWKQVELAARSVDYRWPLGIAAALDAHALPNVHLGVSVEDQPTADLRIPKLLGTPAAVRFLSMEPLLDGVNLDQALADREASRVVPGAPLIRYWIDWIICGGESGPGARPMHPGWARSIRDQCVAAGVPFHFKQWGEWIGGWRYDGSRGEMFVPCSDDGNGNPGPWDWPGDDHRSTFVWSDGTAAIRVGKKAAGRVLDGRTWDEFPADQAVTA